VFGGWREGSFEGGHTSYTSTKRRKEKQAKNDAVGLGPAQKGGWGPIKNAASSGGAKGGGRVKKNVSEEGSLACEGHMHPLKAKEVSRSLQG